MKTVVLDTDLVSFLFKGDTRGDWYKPYLEGSILVISFMTIAELDRWTLERNWGDTRKEKMEQHLKKFVFVPYDRQLCLKWAEACYSARRNGKPISTSDAWVAATALLFDLRLLTHNKNDYLGFDGLTLISETL